LAVVFGLKAYRQYLLGRHFVIRTDHSALQSLRRTPEPSGQQARWQSFVEQFNFVIMHRPGTQHRNADALSRRPPIHSNDEVRHKKCATTATGKKMARIVVSVQGQEQALAEKCMSDLQRDDPDISPVLRRRLEQIEQPKPEETVAESAATKEFYSQWHGLVIRNGILFRRVEGKARAAYCHAAHSLRCKTSTVSHSMSPRCTIHNRPSSETRFLARMASRRPTILPSMPELQYLPSWKSLTVRSSTTNDYWGCVREMSY